tara:strand:- start:135 stop:347 length:213 start_codon:yes stop_codon:yes gene_type:complete
METPLIHQYHDACLEWRTARMEWFELHDLPTLATDEVRFLVAEKIDRLHTEMKSLRTELVAQGILEPRRI